VLDSAPTANVTIGISSTSVAEGTVAPAGLVFTPAELERAAGGDGNRRGRRGGRRRYAYTIVTGVACQPTRATTDLIRAMWRSRMSITTRRHCCHAHARADDNRGRRHGDVHRRAGHAARFDVTIASLLAIPNEGQVAPAALTFTAQKLEYSADGHRDRRCRPGSGRGRGLFHSTTRQSATIRNIKGWTPLMSP